jgi:sigma-B regulation protein RsbU (phosphoserine phosphatase)
MAHPDISLVLKKTNFSSLQQVMAARVHSPKHNEGQRVVSVAKDFKGQNVLTTYTSISPLGWFVFLEQPLAEAFEPLYASIYRTALLLLIGIVLSVIASLVLARRMVKPIRALQEGATLVGAGEFDHRIEIHTGDELESLGEEFNRMATGLKEREQMRQSLFLAREVQQNLLPAAKPQIEGLDIAGSSIYCDETGGDYYDFIINDANENAQIGIAIGDVSGHGISSALLMAAVRSSLRQRSSLPGGAANIISDVNRQLVHDVEDSGHFVTMFYLTVDPIKMHLQYVRAGHDPAIFYDPNTDAFEELNGTGMALGVDKNWNVKAYTKTALKNGQLIFLSTDGVWEARNLQGEMFGKEPIYDIIRKNSSLSANEILNATVESLKNFQNGAKIEDDITLVIIKITD